VGVEVSGAEELVWGASVVLTVVVLIGVGSDDEVVPVVPVDSGVVTAGSVEGAEVVEVAAGSVVGGSELVAALLLADVEEASVEGTGDIVVTVAEGSCVLPAGVVDSWAGHHDASRMYTGTFYNSDYDVTCPFH